MNNYMAPLVLDSAYLALEVNLLAGSIVNSIGVETAGQAMAGFYDLGGDAETTFNHQWGD